ncbi:MAG: hypothetical protein RLZZ241_2424 [Bacteroidota bacterium]|jgi:dephospho-CoA kinase
MMHIGLTGGIGSGKTTVAKYFKALGIPVYDSDGSARILMEGNPELGAELIELLGPATFKDGKLNRKYIANLVFKDSDLLERLNKLVHPNVRQDFLNWAHSQQAPYVIQEAAILFENGGYLAMDYNILVVAPLLERERRVVLRDESTLEDVRARIARQWPDEKKIPLADFVIQNNTMAEASASVLKIHNYLLTLA